MSFKRKQVVMLPTNEKANEGQLVLFPNKPYLGLGVANRKTMGNKYFDGDDSHYQYCHSSEGLGMKPQHLYITSDEEIKEGDWYVSEKSFNVLRVQKPERGYKPTGKKIISSTDKSLGLPEPSQGFIEKYVSEYNKGNIITDVLVEYDITKLYTCNNCGNLQDQWLRGCNCCETGHLWSTPVLKVKVSKDNTITIKKIKDSWTREEFELRLQQYGDYVCNRVLDSGVPIYKSSKEWIEENFQ